MEKREKREKKILGLKSGLSFLEIIIAIALIATFTLLAIFTFTRVRQEEELLSVAIQTVRLLETARGKSLAGENDRAWKVVLTANQVSLQDKDGSSVENYHLPKAYFITSPKDEFLFSRIDGRVDDCPNDCFIEVKEVSGNLSHQLKVLFSGAIEY